MACMTLNIHHGRNETYVHAIKEISSTGFTFFILVSHTSQIDLSHTMTFQRGDSLSHLAADLVPFDIFHRIAVVIVAYHLTEYRVINRNPLVFSQVMKPYIFPDSAKPP